jgi:hypothetical protein
MDLVSRVKGILLSPKSEWATIDTESTTTASLYSGYVVPLAAIPAICTFVGYSVIGMNVLGTAWRRPMGSGLTSAVVSYVMSLVMVFVVALIIDALAPTFGGQKNQMQALKVAAYSATASWVGGIFLLLPSLSLIALLFGLYSLYLLYLGLPALMKAPEEKAVGYTVVVVVCVIVLAIVIVAIQNAVVPGAATGFGMPRP